MILGRGWQKLIDKEIPVISGDIGVQRTLIRRRATGFELRDLGVLSASDREISELEAVRQNRPKKTRNEDE